MKQNFFFILLISILTILPVFPQDADEINNKASAILLTLAQDKTTPESEFNDLKDLFFLNVNEELLQTKYLTNIASFDSLRSHLVEYESEKKGINSDSSLMLLVDWYLHFQRTFYNYNRMNFFNSAKVKILFFTTSVSCPCTMEMCRKQLIEILKLKNKSKDAYSFFIVDSYWNNDLQIEYETYFAPSVLIFNGKNELHSLIEYDEKMPKKLNDTLKKL